MIRLIEGAKKANEEAKRKEEEMQKGCSGAGQGFKAHKGGVR